MGYVVRLTQPAHEEAWLIYNFSDGEVRYRLLCHVAAHRRLGASRVRRGIVARRRASRLGSATVVG